MDKSIEDARKDLNQLPPSGQRDQAFRLLDEIENLEAESRKKLDDLEARLATPAPAASELMLWRWLPWVTAALACYAAYTGISAIMGGEFCTYGRGGSVYCSHGRLAKIQGGTILLIGLIMFLIQMPTARWRTVVLWVLGLFLMLSVYWGLLDRHLFG